MMYFSFLASLIFSYFVLRKSVEQSVSTIIDRSIDYALWRDGLEGAKNKLEQYAEKVKHDFKLESTPIRRDVVAALLASSFSFFLCRIVDLQNLATPVFVSCVAAQVIVDSRKMVISSYISRLLIFSYFIALSIIDPSTQFSQIILWSASLFYIVIFSNHISIIFFNKPSVGEGDAYLMGSLGSVFGFAALYGLLFSVILQFIIAKFFKVKNAPFGPAIFISTVGVVLYINW